MIPTLPTNISQRRPVASHHLRTSTQHLVWSYIAAGAILQPIIITDRSAGGIKMPSSTSWENWAWLLEIRARTRLKYMMSKHQLHLPIPWATGFPLPFDRPLMLRAVGRRAGTAAGVGSRRLMAGREGIIIGEALEEPDTASTVPACSLVLVRGLRGWGIGLVGVEAPVAWDEARKARSRSFWQHATEPLLLFDDLLQIFSLGFYPLLQLPLYLSKILN